MKEWIGESNADWESDTYLPSTLLKFSFINYKAKIITDLIKRPWGLKEIVNKKGLSVLLGIGQVNIFYEWWQDKWLRVNQSTLLETWFKLF